MKYDRHMNFDGSVTYSVTIDVTFSCEVPKELEHEIEKALRAKGSALLELTARAAPPSFERLVIH